MPGPLCIHVLPVSHRIPKSHGILKSHRTPESHRAHSKRFPPPREMKGNQEWQESQEREKRGEKIGNGNKFPGFSNTKGIAGLIPEKNPMDAILSPEVSLGFKIPSEWEQNSRWDAELGRRDRTKEIKEFSWKIPFQAGSAALPSFPPTWKNGSAVPLLLGMPGVERSRAFPTSSSLNP